MKKSIVAGLFALALTLPLTAAPRQPRDGDGSPAERFARMIRRIVRPVVALGPDITVPNPPPHP